jgi:hypothetical protein
MVMSNMGIAVNPRFIYESNRRNTMIKPANLTANFGVVHVSAIGNESPYFGGFDGQKTYIADPANNGAAAIKEALDRNPEGVVCYFKKGGKLTRSSPASTKTMSFITATRAAAQIRLSHLKIRGYRINTN